jgi:hypothetical protein
VVAQYRHDGVHRGADRREVAMGLGRRSGPGLDDDGEEAGDEEGLADRGMRHESFAPQYRNTYVAVHRLGAVP